MGEGVGYEQAIFMGDAKIVVDVINNYSASTSMFSDFIRSCRNLLIDSSGYSVSFVYRDANIWAHKLASASRFL